MVVEADFPDAFRVNLYVRGMSQDRTAEEALGNFVRFPTWCVQGRCAGGGIGLGGVGWGGGLVRPGLPRSLSSLAAAHSSGRAAAKHLEVEMGPAPVPLPGY